LGTGLADAFMLPQGLVDDEMQNGQGQKGNSKLTRPVLPPHLEDEHNITCSHPPNNPIETGPQSNGILSQL
jgi:hypothetical protein